MFACTIVTVTEVNLAPVRLRTPRKSSSTSRALLLPWSRRSRPLQMPWPICRSEKSCYYLSVNFLQHLCDVSIWAVLIQAEVGVVVSRCFSPVVMRQENTHLPRVVLLDRTGQVKRQDSAGQCSVSPCVFSYDIIMFYLWFCRWGQDTESWRLLRVQRP